MIDRHTLVAGSMVRPRGSLTSVALWHGMVLPDQIQWGDLAGFLGLEVGAVVEVVGDKVRVLSSEALGWTYAGNLEEVIA